MLKKSKTLPFWLFTASVIVVLIISQLIQDGLFMDGMIYVDVAKNLATGIGTFWDPHFSATYMPSYHEQPPLYFGLLALFYKVLGTSMYVERLFCFVCFLVTACYIHKLWVKIYTDRPLIKSNSWLPILFWTIIPVCFWAYTNIVEETIMTVFVIVAIYYIYVAIFLNKNPYLNLVVGGILIFLSSLTKGVQGMFPLIAVGLYFLLSRKMPFKKMMGYSLILFLVPVILYGLLLITDPHVYLSFEKYFEARYISTFNNVMNTTPNRFYLITRLFFELMPVMLLSGLVLFFTRKHTIKAQDNKSDTQIIIWFLLIGLSGSLPLLVTLEQRGFYLVTVLPFFALAIAMWTAPRLTLLINGMDLQSRSFKILKIAMMALFLSTLIYTSTKIGDTRRDKDLLYDIYTIGKIIPEGSTIGIPEKMFYNYSLKAYFIRYFNISLTCDSGCPYFILQKDLPKNLISEGYRYYEAGTKKIDLYKLVE